MSDLISRRAAIDYCYKLINAEHQQGSDVMNYGQERVNQTETILHHLEFMPSAQPDLDEWCTDCSEYDQERHCCPRWNRVIRQTLKDAQPERKTGEWIPCSERLPEEDFWSGRGRQFSEHALVTIVNRGNDDERFTDIAQTVDGIWQLSHDVDGDCSLPNWCEVIAWMPLPEPYKGEET